MTTMARKLFDKLALKRSTQKKTTHEEVTPVVVEKKEPAVKRARMATSNAMSKARSAMSKGSKAFVNKFTCCVRPSEGAKDGNVQSTSTTKASRKASKKTKKQLMITARGEEEQLVVPAAQVVVPVWDGDTTPQLPPPRELFNSAHTLDRLNKEAAIKAALEQQAKEQTV